MKTAVVFGATGLVGQYLVEELILNSEYSKVKVFGRREIGLQNSKLEEHIVDFEKLELHKDRITGDEIFICLGTTIKKAGSYEKMEQIDWHYPVRIARLAHANGVESIAVVSSVGASKNTRNKYLRIKGHMEEEIQSIGFDSTIIVRPSILLGARSEKRLGESIGKILILIFAFILQGKFKKYRGIHGRTVARAMVKILNLSMTDSVYESDLLQKLGD